MQKKSGFTLVEIMIVVAIIGLLATLAIPSLLKARSVSRANACINNLRMIDHAKQQAATALNWPETQAIAAGSGEEVQVLSYVRGATTGSGTNVAIVANWLTSTCPGGGDYTVQALATAPTCSLAATVDPAHIYTGAGN
jgi:prepilin-type N-terminal cleavage/methylation domain-containing protein